MDFFHPRFAPIRSVAIAAGEYQALMGHQIYSAGVRSAAGKGCPLVDIPLHSEPFRFARWNSQEIKSSFSD